MAVPPRVFVCTLFEGQHHYGIGALLNSLYAVQVGATGAFWSIFIATSCAVSKGTSSYFADVSTGAGVGYVAISSSGCVDYDTNAVIPNVNTPLMGSTTRTWRSTALVFGET